MASLGSGSVDARFMLMAQRRTKSGGIIAGLRRVHLRCGALPDGRAGRCTSNGGRLPFRGSQL